MAFGVGVEYGTESDGSASDDYCSACYRNGEFAEPEITLQEMIERTVRLLIAKSSQDESLVRPMVATFLPTLKRWQ